MPGVPAIVSVFLVRSLGIRGVGIVMAIQIILDRKASEKLTREPFWV
jgi:hypothetical protein